MILMTELVLEGHLVVQLDQPQIVERKDSACPDAASGDESRRIEEVAEILVIMVPRALVAEMGKMRLEDGHELIEEPLVFAAPDQLLHEIGVKIRRYEFVEPPAKLLPGLGIEHVSMRTQAPPGYEIAEGAVK